MIKCLLFCLWLVPVEAFAFTYSVVEVKGSEAFLLEEGSSHRGAIQSGMVLIGGQTVETGNRSVVFLLSSNGHKIQVGSNSSLLLRAAGTEDGSQINIVEILGGSVRSIIKKDGRDTKKFEMRWRGAAVGVRGTDFLSVVSGSDLSVLLNEGKLFLQNSVALTAGNKAVLSGTGKVMSTSGMSRLEFARAIELAGFGSDIESGAGESTSDTPRRRSKSPEELVAAGDARGLKALGLSASQLNDLGNGEGALHVAARNGRSEMLSAVLEMGANVNAKDSEGKTPLMVAIERKHIPSIKALLSAGADRKITDSSGRNAFDYARLSESREIQNLLAR